MGDAQERAGDYRGAIESFRAALKLVPGQKEAKAALERLGG